MTIEIVQGDALERIARYRAAFPRWPAPEVDATGHIYGTWLIGNNYARERGYYGEYPPTYLRRMFTLFPELPRLHLFSGSLRDKDACCVDATRPEADYQADVLTWLQGKSRCPWATVFADPPYGREEGKRYEGTYPNKRAVVTAISTVMAPNGYLVWLDTSMPIWAKADGWEWAGMITVFTGTNRVLRGAFLLRKRLAQPVTQELFA